MGRLTLDCYKYVANKVAFMVDSHLFIFICKKFLIVYGCCIISFFVVFRDHTLKSDEAEVGVRFVTSSLLVNWVRLKT